MSQDTCSIDGCESPRKSYGWCAMHYGRWKRNGDPLKLVMGMEDPLIRFRRHYAVDADSECWNWIADVTAEGYGIFKISRPVRRAWPAHRWSYTHLVGEVDDVLHIDHLCRNRRCVNPDHLEPVTCRENLLRSPITLASMNLAKTHCVRGHEFTPENTYRPPKAPRSRHCIACRKLRKIRP